MNPDFHITAILAWGSLTWEPKDLNFIMFASSLWEKLSKEDILKIKVQIFNDLVDYYNKLDEPIDEGKWKEYWEING